MTRLRLLPSLLLILLPGCRPSHQKPSPSAHTTAPGVQSGFSIRSPRAGDTLMEGRSYVIRWQAPAGTRVNLGAAMGGKDRGMLLTNAPADPDSLVWTVPVGWITGFGPLSSDQVRLRLENADSDAQWTEAGPFTILGTAPR